MSLTDVAIRNAKTKASMYRLYDARGLYLEVSPKGGKWWRFKYRFAGKEKRLSLGVYPEINLSKARELCDDARRMLRNEVDPSAHRKSAKVARVKLHANTFEAIARDWFAARSPNWAPSHADKVISRLERDVFPVVDLQLNLTRGGCGQFLGLIYATKPRLSRYSTGLRKPSEILMRFSLYQRM